MSFGSRWAAILLFCACALARCVGAAALFGRVTDDAGAPVGDVEVISAYNNFHFSAQTDANGNYTMQLPAGRWPLRFNDSALQPRGLMLLETLNAVVVEEEDQRFDIQLTRATLRLIANVRNTEGAPLEGTIRAQRDGASASPAALIVGGVGELRLTSGPWIVTVSAHGGYKFPPKRRVVMSDERHQIEFTVEPQPTVEIRARLIDENGNGVSSVLMNVRTIAQDSALILSPRTDQDGVFTVTVNAGDILFTPLNNTLIPRTVLHAPTSGRYEHVIQMRRATGEIVVRRSGGGSATFTASALRDGKIHTISRSLQNELRIPVFDEDWQIFVHANRHDLPEPEASTISIKGQSQIVNVSLAPLEQTARIRGHVVDTANNPVPFASVTALRVSQGQLWQSLSAGADGAFDFPVAPGDWRLTVTENTSGMLRRSTFLAAGVQPGEVREIGNLGWPGRGARVTVRLKDEAGNPLDADWPYLEPSNLRPRLSAEDSRGFYEATALTHGREFVFDVTPGTWTFSAVPGGLNRVGYADIRPINFNVTAAGATLDVPVRRLRPGSETPRLDIVRTDWSHETILTFFAEEFHALRIETSTNLRDWTFHSFSEWNRELVAPSSQEPRFFRAITEY